MLWLWKEQKALGRFWVEGWYDLGYMVTRPFRLLFENTLKWGRYIILEAVRKLLHTTIPMRDVGRLDPVSSKGDCELWQNSGFIFKVESIHVLTDWLYSMSEWKESKMTQRFWGWAIRKWELSIIDMRETVSEANLGEDKSRNPFLDMLILKYLFDIWMELSSSQLDIWFWNQGPIWAKDINLSTHGWDLSHEADDITNLTRREREQVQGLSPEPK